MDFIDLVSENQSILTNASINRVRANASKQEVEARGYCLICYEELTDERRWCSPECRDDWEEQNKKTKGIR